MLVLRYLRSDRWPSGGTATIWECRCDCGSVIERAQSNVKTSTSCGCIQLDRLRAAKRKPQGQAGKSIAYVGYRGSARARNLDFQISLPEFVVLTSKTCFYCGSLPSLVAADSRSPESIEHSQYVYNGLDRVDNDRGYVLDNVVPCCAICNFAKHSLTQDVFVQWIARAYRHLHGVVE